MIIILNINIILNFYKKKNIYYHYLQHNILHFFNGYIIVFINYIINSIIFNNSFLLLILYGIINIINKYSII